MINVYWLFGPTCVGKTTFASRLKLIAGTEFDVTVVHTGSLARTVMTDKDMSENENSLAPANVERAIRDAVLDAVAIAKEGSTVIVDSMPRTLLQVEFIRSVPSLTTRSVKSVVLYCTAPDHALRDRQIERASIGAEAKALLNSRRDVESRSLSLIADAILRSDIEARLVDLGDTERSAERLFEDLLRTKYPLDLRGMFELHAQFANMTLGKFSTSLEAMHYEASQKSDLNPMDNSMVWSRRFLEHGIAELQEALDEIPNKFWAKNYVNVGHLREEIIDAWHFIMSAAIASGMDGSEFSRMYYEKRQKNIDRQNQGYESRKNG